MKLIQKTPKWAAVTMILFTVAACQKNEMGLDDSSETKTTITVENVLVSKPLVESGEFKGSSPSNLILPGQSVTIEFSAARKEAISFATMYGWSNDLFFAPLNPGILVYDTNGNPIQGDVSEQVKLWDNGTRINQAPGANVNHPGVADSKIITEVKGTDAQGNTYLPASNLIKATLKYIGNSVFNLTLENTSGGTANQTPLSPGVWAVSYVVGENLQNATPLYSSGKPTANGLTDIAEMGSNTRLCDYLKTITGIFTPLSPILVVVYNGIENPIYKVGEVDRGQGLKALAQMGNADTLANYLKGKPGIKAVYVLPDPATKVLLPIIGNQAGGKVSQEISVSKNDKLAIATMYGFSNDWFFATSGDDIDATQKGDISMSMSLFDNGTAINQFPGAGITQFNLAGTPLKESKVIAAVPNPNAFTTLPAITDIIRVILQ
ncbi:hypothetical protein ADIARSV_0402 [Arcticibacter svalbardensis MN12-7]|uniref:Secreted protein n=1 Tax=Arcticibacter svalbardensis MN12-7 TaxID=1150600 RepID=R9GX56_9SPHI|nr:spondin domain-containing protein [Arcticibacter svalbardensis]EOR96402.1 hypothetical protein ADIARSV_0402 [Arcticibacter svalbardensis MN12-7]